MAVRMVGFSRSRSTDKVWSVGVYSNDMESEIGQVYFTFDKKTIYNYWTDYRKLTDEQKWLFDDAFEFWACFGESEEEISKLQKEHPNWSLPEDLEDDGEEIEPADIEFFSNEEE